QEARIVREHDPGRAILQRGGARLAPGELALWEPMADPALAGARGVLRDHEPPAREELARRATRAVRRAERHERHSPGDRRACREDDVGVRVGGIGPQRIHVRRLERAYVREELARIARE